MLSWRASEIHAEACRNSEIATLNNEVDEKLHSLIAAATKTGRQNGQITDRYTVKEQTDWVVSVYEVYIGKIAIQKNVKRNRCAQIAKASVLQFLAPDS